jgi:hypothetical protein
MVPTLVPTAAVSLSRSALVRRAAHPPLGITRSVRIASTSRRSESATTPRNPLTRNLAPSTVTTAITAAICTSTVDLMTNHVRMNVVRSPRSAAASVSALGATSAITARIATRRSAVSLIIADPTRPLALRLRNATSAVARLALSAANATLAIRRRTAIVIESVTTRDATIKSFVK